MQKQTGFTLIEVMVAFMVAAIGLLGVMGLQNTAIRNNVSSTAQMQAVLLSEEMADLVRANPQAMEDSRAYNNISGADNSACTAGGCAPTDMAAYDKWLWDKRVVENIGPGAEGVVCIDSTPDDGTSAAAASCDGTGDLWVVKLWWKDGIDESNYDTLGQEWTTADLLFIDVTSGPSFYMSFMP